MSKTRVLIIDDDSLTRYDASYALRKAGWDVHEADSGELGVRMATELLPDLILLDVIMTGIDGIGVLRKLKSGEKTSGIPVLLLTGLDTKRNEEIFREEGANGVCQKPFTHRELIRLANDAMHTGSIAKARPVIELESAIYLRDDDQEDAANDTAQEAEKIAPPQKSSLPPVSLRQSPAPVTVFLGVKGGVGASTLAVYVARSLAADGLSTVLAEIRTNVGSLATLLNLNSKNHLGKLLEQNQTSPEHLENSFIRADRHLRVLLGPQSNCPHRLISGGQATTILQSISRLADMVVLDLEPGLSAVNLALLRQCQQVMLVMEDTHLSIQSAKSLIRELQSVISSNEMKAVLVRRSQLASPVSISKIRSELPCQVVSAIPPTGNELEFAAHRGCNLFQTHPDALAATTFRSIAREFCNAGLTT